MLWSLEYGVEAGLPPVCYKQPRKNPINTRYQFSSLFSKTWMESMTIRNITAAFKVMGTYPVNREVISFPREETSLSKTVVYPTLRPAPKHSTHPLEKEDDFTEEELIKFNRRYKNGYDLLGDSRHNLWLATHHPDSPVCQRVWLQCMQTTSVSQFLQCPLPPAKIPTVKPKSCGWVLTSANNIALMEEKKKETKSRRKERATAERKWARDQNTAMKTFKVWN